MPISQMSRVNPIETPPQPKRVETTPERESTLSPEMPKVEFGHDRLSEKVKQDVKLNMPIATSSTVSNDVVNQKFKKIEAILEEDLSDIYFNLTPQKQQEFKIKGEETTIKIINLLSKPKLQVKKIIALIRDWLKVVPGINVFFLEQIVKIKADKIINESAKRK